MDALLHLLSAVATFILIASLKGTVLVALVLLAQKLFGRFLTANGRYLLWLPVAVSLVTPVGFDAPLPQAPDFVLPVQLQAAGASTMTAPPRRARGADAPDASMAKVSVDATDAELLPNWQVALALLWLAGSISVFCMMFVATRRFAALARAGQDAPEALQRLLRESLREAQCATRIRLVVSSGLRAPAVAGLFNPVLLWPTALERQLAPAQLRHVFMHELMHVKRLDTVSAGVVALLQALHWFNPAIWIAFSCLRHDREVACDASTVRALAPADADSYAQTLIDLGAIRPETKVHGTGLAILGSHTHLRRRILMLARKDDAPRTRQVLTAVVFAPFAVFAFSKPFPAADVDATATPQAAVASPLASAPMQMQQAADARPLVNATAAPELADPAPSAARREIVSPALASNDEPPLLAEATVRTLNPMPVYEPDPLPEPGRTATFDALLARADTEALRAALLPETTTAAQVVATEMADSPRDDGELICRRFYAQEADPWRACDYESAWKQFANDLGLAPASLPGAEALRPDEKPIGLQDEICRYQTRTASLIKLRSCGNAAQWISVDLMRMGRCGEALTPDGHLQQLCMLARYDNQRASWNMIPPITAMPSPWR